MKPKRALAAAIMAVVLSSGCGGSRPEAPGDAPATPEGSGTYSLDPDTDTRSDSAVAPTGLEHSTWQAGALLARFLPAGRVFVSGGPIERLAPLGVVGEYAVEGTALTLGAMGYGLSGSWDGASMTLGGHTAARIE